MNTSKQIFEKNRRIKKSKLVDVRFYTKNHFKVVDGIKVKYCGVITTNGIFNACSCPSFKFGMDYMKDAKCLASNYFSEHGHTFHCKHIIAAIVKKDELK